VTALGEGMLAGADSIDGMALLRHSAMRELFDRTSPRRRCGRSCAFAFSATSVSWMPSRCTVAASKAPASVAPELVGCTC
jgi:hypothetical protein